MRTKGKSFASAVGAITLVVTLGMAGAARAAVAQIAIDPPNPSPSDAIAIGVSGVFPTSCIPRNPTTTLAPGTITIDTTNSDPFCFSVATPYTLPDVEVGPLAAGLYCVTVTYAHGGPPVNLAEQCFTVAEVSAFNGTAKQVGKAAQPNQAGGAIVNISGKFFIGSPSTLDLTTSTIKVTGILTENGDELSEGIDGVNPVPVLLRPRHLARTDRAVFDTSGTIRPTVRLQLRRLASNLYVYTLKVRRATIPHTAAACSTGPEANLVTSFEITDSSTGDVAQISTRNAWQCQGVTLKTKSAPSSGGSSGPSNRCADPGSGAAPAGNPPRASLRTNLLTRDTGLPNLVQLDASGTTAGAGTLVDYQFTVFTQGACGVVFGPVHSGNAKIQTTLPPGEYVGSVIVKDSLGSESEAAQRGFSTP